MTTNVNPAATQHDPFADFDIPSELEESLRRHREHLAKLVLSLRSAGVHDSQIEESVSVLVASYKDELLRAIKTMMA